MSKKNFCDSIICEQKLYIWASGFIKRFPKWIDTRLIKGLYSILGLGVSDGFLKKRSSFHLKRLLLTQFFLQKSIEKNLADQKEKKIFIRIFSINNLLCLAIAYPRKENFLTEEILIEITSQKIATLRKINGSFYQWEKQDPSYVFCYLELEKMRGKNILKKEIKDLEIFLKKDLDYFLSETSVFWPYNHEEAFKQLLTLSKEISSPKDCPQVSIHFQKQTIQYLEFLVCLARPTFTNLSKPAIVEDDFSLSIQLITHIRQETHSNLPITIEAFSLCIPAEPYKKNKAINLLHARESVAKLLEGRIGRFRDYNGGLFETQKNHFGQLFKSFSGKISNFSLFAKDLFYALQPIEVQICLDDALFQYLFKGFSQALNHKQPFLSHRNRYVIIFKHESLHQLAPYLKRVKTLQKQGAITAFASLTILSTHYLCIVDKHGRCLNYFKKVKARDFA